jgi:hypothetical protein
VDTIPGRIYAADHRYLYGQGSAGSRVLTRFDPETYAESRGAAFSGAVHNAWTTSVLGEVFVISAKNSLHTLHRSTDYGAHFTQVLRLGQHASGQSTNVRILHRGLCEVRLAGQRAYLIGEYNVNTSRQPGGSNDAVRILKSTNGVDWQTLYTFNQGTHTVRHVHVCAQDPRTGHIYFGTGDSGSEVGIFAWDGQAAWPSQSKTPAQFASLSGFDGVGGQKRYWVADFLFPQADTRLYAGLEGANVTKESEKGLWAHTADLLASTRVYSKALDSGYNGSGLRLGVLMEVPAGQVQVWADVGDPALFNQSVPNYVTFYLSAVDQFGSGQWQRSATRYAIAPGQDYAVPRGMVVRGDRLYFSAAGNSATGVYEVQ